MAAAGWIGRGLAGGAGFLVGAVGAWGVVGLLWVLVGPIGIVVGVAAVFGIAAVVNRHQRLAAAQGFAVGLVAVAILAGTYAIGLEFAVSGFD